MGALYCIFCFVLLFCVNRLESAYDESHRYDQTHQYNYDPYQTGYDQRQEELNSLRENTCSRFDDQRDEFIIDIKTSVARGAKMIEAVKAHSLIECANLCCDNLSCDLGVFRVSSDLVHTEHNCYLITCGNAANCVMAYHREFIAVMFTSVQETVLTSIGRENSPIDNDNSSVVSEALTDSHDQPQTDSYDQPQTDSHDQPQTDSHDQPQTDSHDQPQTDSRVNPEATATQVAQPTKTDSHASASSSKPVKPTQDSKPSQNPVPKIQAGNKTWDQTENQDPNLTDVFSLVPSSVYHHDDDHLPTRDPCNVHGCNGGSGIIVISVVGCVAFLVVFFVGIIVTRKLYSNRQKKHYHNVDYLINGMYT